MRLFPRKWASMRKVQGIVFAGCILVVCFAAAGCRQETAIHKERSANVPQESALGGASASTNPGLERQTAGSTRPNRPEEAGSSHSDSHPDMLNEEEIGLPIYPNARIYRMPGDSGGGVKSGNGMNLVLLETPDKPEPVIAFYEPRLTHSAHHSDRFHGGTMIVRPERQDRLENGRRIVKFTETLEDRTIRIVKITRETDSTVIELMNIHPSVPQNAMPHPASTSATAGAPGSMEASSTTPQPENQQDPLTPRP